MIAAWTVDFGGSSALAPHAEAAPRAHAVGSSAAEPGEPDFFVVLQDRMLAPDGAVPAPEAEASEPEVQLEREPAPEVVLIRTDAEPTWTARADVPVRGAPEAMLLVGTGPSPASSVPSEGLPQGSSPSAIGDASIATLVATVPSADLSDGVASQDRIPLSTIVDPAQPAVESVRAGSRGQGEATVSATAPQAQMSGAGQGNLAASTSDGVSVETVEALRMAPDLEQVDPEMRARLERVIGRMRSEFGHNVTVVEAYRTPERQAALYAQGRSAPGQVVTWTEQSMHSEGLAVDVMVDGSWAPHEGYRRLGRIAAEEGLRTLWPNDPGHIQMDRAAAGTTQTETTPRMASIATVATVAAPAPQAELATPALVATVAPPAQPAELAAPAAPALPATPPTGPMPPLPELADPTAEQRTALTSTDNTAPIDIAVRPSGEGQPGLYASVESTPQREGALSDNGEGRSQRERTRALAEAAVNRAARLTPETFAESLTNEGALAASVSEGATVEFGETTLRVRGMSSAEGLHRVTQVREMQELAYPKRLGQVTLRMLDGLGEEARMRVRLAGADVSASIGVRDVAQASEMRSRIGTLERALRARGIDNVSVRVNAMATGTGPEVGALTAQAISANRGAATAQSDMQWSQQQSARQDSRSFTDAQSDSERRPSDDSRRQDPRNENER